MAHFSKPPRAGPVTLLHMRLVLILCLLALAAPAQEIATLSFLTGCWQMTAGPIVIEETWGKPAPDGMLGFSRTLKNGKTVFSEFMRIDKPADTIEYTPRIGTRQGPVVFKLIKLTADEEARLERLLDAENSPQKPV